MSQSTELAQLLLGELKASQERLSDWLDPAPFSRPKVPAIPDPTFQTWPLNFVALVVGIFFARLDWNLRAVIKLCEGGMAVQAQPVVRSILESAVDLRYISTNPQVLVTKWCLFEEIKRYQFWLAQPPQDRPDDYGYLERQTQKRLSQLNRHRPHGDGKPWKISQIAKDWDGSSLAHREKVGREAVGAESAFYGIYRLLSGSLHGGFDSANDFVMIDRDGKFHLVRGVENRKRVFVLWATLHCLTTTLAAAQRCGAEIGADIAPQWDSLDITPDELAAEASADWKYAEFQG